MSLQYIIDAYNIINHPLFTQRPNKKTKNSKVALVDFIRINRLCGSPKNKITVVFDGYPDPSCNNMTSITDINIIFSRKETADEKIKRLVEAAANPKNTVVVSDDKEIKFFVKAKGAHWISVEEFIGRKEKPEDKKELLKPELSYSQVHEINRELKKLWLK